MKMIRFIFLYILVSSASAAFSQEGDRDSLYLHDTVRSVVNKFNHLKFSGYLQPQYQVAEEKGIASYEGGNFQKNTDNRFMVRRARLKTEYTIHAKDSVQTRKGLFAFQLEATERGVNVIEAYGRWFPLQPLAVTVGVVDHPFGHEVLFSSSSIESPERGRASQILLPAEKDLGAMISIEPKGKVVKYLKLDAGLFNGQGYTGPTDFDSFKDLNARLTVKPVRLGAKQFFSGGVSALYGGWVQENKHRFHISDGMTGKTFADDSSLTNMGSKAPREYLGIDGQLLWKHKGANTILRGEYWTGVQSGTSTSTVSPGSLPTAPVYVRNFNAAFFYLVQSFLNNKWEAVVKYDWYDPNKKVEENGLTEAGKFTQADIRYNTLGVGLTHYITPNLKVLGYYAMVKNESTALPGYTSDVEDNVFTLRMQVKF